MKEEEEEQIKFKRFSSWCAKQIYDVLCECQKEHAPDNLDYEYHDLIDNIDDVVRIIDAKASSKNKISTRRDDMMDQFMWDVLGIKEKSYKWDKPILALLLHLLKNHPSEDIREKLYAALDQEQLGWIDNKTYNRSHACTHTDSGCRDRMGISEVYWDEIFSDFEKIFLDNVWGGVTSVLFAYCVTSLFASRLNFNEIHFPFPLHIACDRGSNIPSLIESIVSICDVNMPIPSNCRKEIKPAFAKDRCLSQAPTVYTITGHMEYDLRELKRFRDIPVIVTAFGEWEEADLLIRRITNQQPVDTRSLNGGLNTLPIFISDARDLPKSYNKSIFLDLHDKTVPPDHLELLKTYCSQFGSWVDALIDEAPKKLLQPEPCDDESPIYHCKALNRRLINYQGRFRQYADTDLTNDDFLSIATLSFFFEQFLQQLGGSLREYGGAKVTFDNTKFIVSDDTPLGISKGVASRITVKTAGFLSHVQTSQYADQFVKIDIRDQDTDEDKSEQIRKKGKQYLKTILSAYKDYGVRLLAKKKASYVDGRYIFPVTLGQGTHLSKITANAAEIRMILGLPYFHPAITRDSIEFIVSDRGIAASRLADLLESPEFINAQGEIPYVVGKNILGEPVIEDIESLTQLLIGGETNSGKSSALHSLLMSIAWKQPSDKVKLLLMDFGSSGLSKFESVPHLLEQPGHVISNRQEGYEYLRRLYKLMEEREAQSQKNEKVKERWPFVVCAMDEVAGLIDDVPEAADIITQLLERSRKQKIHMVLCSQVATLDRLKFRTANIPSRLAFKCNNSKTSEVILGHSGAERLTGIGSLYLNARGKDLTLVYGSYMDPAEIPYCLAQHAFQHDGTYHELILPDIETEETQTANSTATTSISHMSSCRWQGVSSEESLVQEVTLWIHNDEKETISANQIKKRFHKGQDGAKKCIDTLEELGIVPPRQGKSNLPRSVDLNAVKRFLDENHLLSENSDIHAEHSVTEV